MNTYTFHINLYDVGFFATICIGLTLAALLWSTKKRTQSANRWLAAAVTVVVLEIAHLLGSDIQLGHQLRFWDSLPLQCSLALGPLLFLYVRKTAWPEILFRRRDLLHFSPLLLQLGAYRFRPVAPVIQLGAFGSVAIYLWRCRLLIKDFYGRQTFQDGDRYRNALRWLNQIVTGFDLVWLLWIPVAAVDWLVLPQHAGPAMYYSWYLLVAGAIIGMAAVAFLRPEHPEAVPPVLPPSVSAAWRRKGSWLKKVVKDNRHYQDPELSLGSLAGRLGLSIHELSRIINTGLGKSFHDFINEYRVLDAARKMQDPAYDQLTLLGIAFESGFNSQSTFNRIFKQMTGKSPLEYKNEQKKEYPAYKLGSQSRSMPLILHPEDLPKWSPDKINRQNMFRNYVKIAWRNMTRHKVYSAINIAGLSVGIAAFLLIAVAVGFERSFDDFQAKNCYRITSENVLDGIARSNPGISAPAVDAFRLAFPQAKVAGICMISGSQVTVPPDNGNAAMAKKFIEEAGIMFAEPQLFDVLSAQWLAGDPSALKDPNMVVIDESHANKYFGDWKSAVGKILHVDNLLTLKVAGVLRDPPANSDFRLHVLISYITWKQHAAAYNYVDTWDVTSSGWQVFIRFPDKVSKSTIDRQLLAFSDKQWSNKKSKDRKKYAIAEPLHDIHFDTRFQDGLGDHATSKATLNTLSLIAVLIVLMASINFVNLSTAQSVGRSREVGVRKVLGSSRGQLVTQVMGEAMIVVLISAVLGGLGAEVALPFAKRVAIVPDSISLFNGSTLLYLVVLAPVIIIVAGLYPALVVSGFKPVVALKNKISAASVGGISLRRVLVVTQFAISQMLIIGTVIAIQQMDFVNHADLGFDQEAVLVIPCPTDSIGLSRLNSFKQQVLTLPGVKAASFTSDAPSSDNNNSTDFAFDHSNKNPGFDLYTKTGDADYFKTFGLRFVAGGRYGPSDTARQIVVNETLVKLLGLKRPEEALGKTILIEPNKWMPITGVVQDFKTNSMREKVKPIVIFPQKAYESEIGVKMETGKLTPTVARVQQLWESHYPEYAYAGFFLDDNIAKFYKQENQLEWVYKAFVLIAIVISCLGLYGLVSFMVVQRTKEVGVRKVLGASVTNIVFLFSKEFLLLITIAFLIAVPAGWYLMSGWLQTFAYRISISADIFLIAIIGSLLLAWLTVGYKAVRAALANPVKSLRTEG